MSEEKKASVTAIDEARKTLGPELKMLEDAAYNRGKTEGATAERDRIKGIESHATLGHEALIAEMKFDGKTTPDEAAGRILAAEKTKRAGKLTEIRDNAEKPVNANADPNTNNDAEAKQRELDKKMPPEQFAVIAAKRAEIFVAEQAKLGRTISSADAVAYVYDKAGVPKS